jgi:hypothetical protein
MRFDSHHQSNVYRSDARANAFALAGAASLPILVMFAISTLGLAVIRTIWRLLN